MALGECGTCFEEAELSPFGLCAACQLAAERLIRPKVEAVIDDAREHPIGRHVISIFEDWAAGHKARKNKGEPKP